MGSSESLIGELRATDGIVIAPPVYNFGSSAALKAWFDLVLRVRVTFRYRPDGPVGLLEGKRATAIIASGGTRVGSRLDFATPWVRHVLGFIGITDVEVVAAEAPGPAGAPCGGEGADQAARRRLIE